MIVGTPFCHDRGAPNLDRRWRALRHRCRAAAGFPLACACWAAATYDELRRDLATLAGVDVAIGLDPISTNDEEERRRTDEFFTPKGWARTRRVLGDEALKQR